MVHIRPAGEGDARFLQEMVAVAADWRPGAPVRSVDEIMREPWLAHYASSWPRVGDVGVVAERARPIGAAWYRFFSADHPGFGFVDESTPELAVGVVENHRGRGIGTLLLEALIDAARHRGVAALSLSVEMENPARRLYERLGFEAFGMVGGAATLLLRLERRPPEHAG